MFTRLIIVLLSFIISIKDKYAVQKQLLSLFSSYIFRHIVVYQSKFI